MMIIKFRRLFSDPMDEVIYEIKESMKLISSEYNTSEEFSNLLFDKLLGNEISARIISYSFDDKPFYSVQYYKKGKWINFDYNGLDMFFQPIYHKTLKPENIVKEEMINLGNWNNTI